MTLVNSDAYCSTSSARNNTNLGSVRPGAYAVLRLITSSGGTMDGNPELPESP